MTTLDNIAVSFNEVSKTYTLYETHRDRFVDVFGLTKIGLKLKHPVKQFVALNGVSFEVVRGSRIGVIGRNGAGKTTMLKLMCENFSPSAGSVKINGNVQALMSSGLGFHPEFTGRENVIASLQYSGIAKEDYKKALKGIIEFCELGDFIDQPFKTYSLGMQARLMFAAATAIEPDILIVDEVLGAGDAYFLNKSRRRMDQLINSGCTMLLVSHDMGQVLDLCEEAIWMDGGELKMRGTAFEVVKAYEEFLYGSVNTLTSHRGKPPRKNNAKAEEKRVGLNKQGGQITSKKPKNSVLGPSLQEPSFKPNEQEIVFPTLTLKDEFLFEASGGISRWESTLPGQIEVAGFSISDTEGFNNDLMILRPAKFSMLLNILVPGSFNCRYVVTVTNEKGHLIASIKSPKDSFFSDIPCKRLVDICLNPIQLGPGDYYIGLVVMEYGPLENINTAKRYDLLNRSFKFSISVPSSMETLNGHFFHTAEWNFLES